MSLVIATGSNLGDRKANLDDAKKRLCNKLDLIAESRIYHSQAVDYCDQPDFYNQVLEFTLPKSINAIEVMNFALDIEKEMGRERLIARGPRLIDIDILFYGDFEIRTEHLVVPHPRLFERSFVVKPLSELPCFTLLSKRFIFNEHFEVDATPI